MQDSFALVDALADLIGTLEQASPLSASLITLLLHPSAFHKSQHISEPSLRTLTPLTACPTEPPASVARCVEIGSGSGYVICSVALLLRHHGIRGQCIAVDINPAACSCTQQTLRNHQVPFS